MILTTGDRNSKIFYFTDIKMTNRVTLKFGEIYIETRKFYLIKNRLI